MTDPSPNNSDWWKWGDPEKSFHLDDFPKLRTFLEEKWNVRLTEGLALPDRVSMLPAPLLQASGIEKIFPDLKADQYSDGPIDRLKHSAGKSYHDIIKIFSEKELPAPDFVLYPESQKDVVHILEQALQHNIKVMTFSGGSNVTGALDIEEGKQPVCSLDMKRMNRLVEIDEISHTAVFEAGIFGPELEGILNKKGFTLGHFPQSFEFSTLGGWIVTRSAGQESGRYGKIEDMVLGLTAVTPAGTIENIDFPRHASGVDVHTLFVGSEGTFGVVVQAKIQIHAIPAKYKWVVALFKDYEAGIFALRKMVQSGVHPTISRLSDQDETRMLSLFSKTEKTGLSKILEKSLKFYIKAKGYTKPSILLMKFAICNKAEELMATEAQRIAKSNGGFIIPGSSSANWEKNRFSLPYLRDTLVEHGVLIDTFETVSYWNNLLPLYNGVKQSLADKSDYYKKGGLLFCHVSHIYPTGASLYFTLMAPQEKGNELGQWSALKTIVTDAIAAHGGAISHHHGIGKDHRKWHLDQLPESSKRILRAIKAHFDPDNILNPGKLYDDSE